MRYSYIRGALFCLFATASWGAMFPVMTGALKKIDPFTFTSIRYTIAGTAFLLLLLLKEGRGTISLKGERLGLIWFLGTAGFAGFGFLVFLGQQLAGKEGALTAAIVMATQPMLGLLVNWIVRKVVPPVYSFAFILLSLCGIILVITKGNVLSLIHEPQNYLANAIIMMGCLSWVIYTVGAAFFPKWSPYKYTAITTMFGLSSVFTINGVLLASGVIAAPSANGLLSIVPHFIYMIFISGFLGVLCWNVGNKILTPLNGVLFMDVVPLTGFTISALQGVVPTGAQLVGASLTCAALILNNLYLRYRTAKPVTPTPAPVKVWSPDRAAKATS